MPWLAQSTTTPPPRAAVRFVAFVATAGNTIVAAGILQEDFAAISEFFLTRVARTMRSLENQGRQRYTFRMIETMPDTKYLISVADAAEQFGVSQGYLRQLVGDDRIARHHVHKRYYLLDQRSVEKFFKSPRKVGRPRKNEQN